MFFSEEKNQKTFVSGVSWKNPAVAARIGRGMNMGVFLLLGVKVSALSQADRTSNALA
jgi:hypothetical protein